MSTSSTSQLNSNLSLSAPQTATTGTSSFASDLQASVNRALEIASLPMQALQADQSTISGQTGELSTLSGLFNSLETSLQNITSGTGTNALQATSSDQSVATASVTGSALAGTYTVQVLNAGSYSSATSNSATAVADPTSQNISSSTSFTLTVGTTNYNISASNLNSLATCDQFQRRARASGRHQFRKSRRRPIISSACKPLLWEMLRCS